MATKENNDKLLQQMKERYDSKMRAFPYIAEDVADRLLKYRKDANLTQQEVSDIVGISRQSLAYYERGERTPDLAILYKLAAFYGISVDSLITKTEAETELREVGLTLEAASVLWETPDLIDLLNDLLTHPQIRELCELTICTRNTEFEFINMGYRSFLASKLLYSIIGDILKKWYEDNDCKIKELSQEEKGELLHDIEQYFEEAKYQAQAWNTYINDENVSESLYDLYLDHDKQVEILYNKVKKYF